MRILLISSMLPQADGAGAIPLLLHAELVGLSARHQVTLVTGIGDEPGEEEAAQALVRDGVDLHLADRRRPPPGLRRLRRQLRLAATWTRGRWPWRTVWFAHPGVQTAIDQLCARSAFDVVAVDDSAMAVYRLPAGTAAVLTEHEVQDPRELAADPSASFSGWPRRVLRQLDGSRWKKYQPAVWRRFDRLQVFTERDARSIAQLAPDVAGNVRVNPFGLVLPPLPDPDRERPGTVLFVGNFTHPPNRDAAIWLAHEILPAIRRRQPSARLRIVGAAAPQDVLALARADVDVVADAPSVGLHYEEACVVVAPVRTGGGMRMKVLHALASGKPVVTTPRGIDGLTTGGRRPPVVVADDVDGIAAAVGDLLHDGARRRELGERGRGFAMKHHSPAAWASRLEDIYQEARNGRRGVHG